jgi:hypothetical protein
LSRRFHPPLRQELADETAERVRQSHEQAIGELQDVAIMRGKLIKDIELPDLTEVTVAHGLGHRATLFFGIPLQLQGGAATGRIMDITLLRTVDANNFSVLLASGFGVKIKISVWAV